MLFWGKTDSSDAYHELRKHCLDVAAVAQAFWERDSIFRGRIAALAPGDSEKIRRLFILFAALHDLGKFALPFQYKVPDLARSLDVPEWRQHCGVHHTSLGYGFWKDHAAEIVPDIIMGVDDIDDLEPLAEVVFGHHGQPVKACDPVLKYFRGVESVALDFVREAGEFFCSDLDVSGLRWEAIPYASWLLSGLMVFSDWLGSNEKWFKPEPEWPGIGEYWPRAHERAERAVAECRVLPPPVSCGRGFHDLMPHLRKTDRPSPLQQWAMDCPLGDGPQLFILEDLTGGGKTEAALLLAHRLLERGDASGFYAALPTMATANAMYARLAASYRALFEEDAHPSLMLAHGARSIHDDFLESIDLEKGSDGLGHEKAAREDGGAECAHWLADNRKKALLAPCGVGTVDQALLAVLPSRHQCLRLLGLSRSVLIVDEVHAYDEYTGTLLYELLKFHAALGGSAILLSATLPLSLRQKLLDSHAEGLALGGAATEPDLGEAVARSNEFPLATGMDGSGCRETAIAESRRLDVAVDYTTEQSEVYKALAEAHKAGACSCWIRNTVHDALEAVEALQTEYGLPAEDMILFHARFTMKDRLDIEARVLETFGKVSGAEDRRGKVLVATQVAEQSLDFDADFMVSDLAPIDLLIQRAGRCHRHAGRTRPAGCEKGRLLVYGPNPVAEPSADWYGRVFEKGQYVYPEQAVLWRTAGLLLKHGGLRLPENSRLLVEGAYAGHAPQVLLDSDMDAQGRAYADKSLAWRNALRFKTGYSTESADTLWEQDARTPTRLGREMTALRLVRVEEGGLRLWAGRDSGDVSMSACLNSEVGVDARYAKDAVVPPDLKGGLAKMRESMPDKGKWAVLLPVSLEGGSWTGMVLSGGKQSEVRYDPAKGLVVNSLG